ncbi:MAG: hypothetical protein QG659_227 [Patescibacteria group bacterium]|nr:hypothetical protein [Patescibacteria group bacterium]
MPEKSPSNPFIDAIILPELNAALNLINAGMIAGFEAVASATSKDEAVFDISECLDVDPTTQLFV